MTAFERYQKEQYNKTKKVDDAKKFGTDRERWGNDEGIGFKRGRGKFGSQSYNIPGARQIRRVPTASAGLGFATDLIETISPTIKSSVKPFI